MESAFLFPGQGSQVPNMLHTLPDHPAVSRTLDEVSDALGEDVRELDTAENLQHTHSVQLALLAAGIAAARALLEEGVVPQAVAGLSVGAFAAATIAGVIGLRDTVALVKQRAELMTELFPYGYGLVALTGLFEEEVSRLVKATHAEHAPVYVANINGPRQIVIAGSDEGIDRLMDTAQGSGLRKAQRLPIATLSHCVLLEPVAISLRRALDRMQLHDANIAYIANVNARRLRNAKAITDDLASNIAHGVRWYDMTSLAVELGCDLFIEMPPGNVLTELGKEAFPSITNIALSQVSLRDVRFQQDRLEKNSNR